MRAKLVGFMEPVNTVWRLYREDDKSLPAVYAGAVAAYRQAVAAAPNAPLIAFEFARAATQWGGPEVLAEAAERLERALRVETDNGSAWRVLGTAYGMQGKMGEAALALAESEWHFGNAGLAVQQARRAQDLLSRDSAGWLRAEDLRLSAERHSRQQ